MSIAPDDEFGPPPPPVKWTRVTIQSEGQSVTVWRSQIDEYQMQVDSYHTLPVLHWQIGTWGGRWQGSVQKSQYTVKALKDHVSNRVELMIAERPANLLQLQFGVGHDQARLIQHLSKAADSAILYHGTGN